MHITTAKIRNYLGRTKPFFIITAEFTQERLLIKMAKDIWLFMQYKRPGVAPFFVLKV